MSDAAPTVLRAGYHHWWYAPDGHFPDPSKLAAQAYELGAVGVLLHCVGTAKPQLAYAARPDFQRSFANLQATVALGSRGPDHWEGDFAGPAIAALRAGFPVMLDWEIAWDAANGLASAARAVDKILAAVPDAIGRVTDCPWWAPRKRPRGGATHPHAPTAEFGTLCARERYPQAYGAATTYELPDGTVVHETPAQVEGRSLRMVQWSRDASEYPSYGTPAAQIFPTFQLYQRTVTDVCVARLAEPRACGWEGREMDADARRGHLAALAIKSRGFTTVAEFQLAAGLASDGQVGPKTLAALGLQ